MNHKGTKQLETDRLLLRQFTSLDADAMYRNWANNENVTKFLTWPAHKSVEVTEKVLNSWLDNYKKPEYYQWCMEYKETHEAIGTIGVVRMEEAVDAVEIGYCIGEQYWHKGIMTEALTKLVEFLFEEVECHRICAYHDVANPHSGGVMRNAGLSYEGTLKKAGKNNMGICDLAVYGIVR